MKEIVATKREALFLKRSDLDRKVIQKIDKRYTFHFYNEKACETCEFFHERDTEDGEVHDVCSTCGAYNGGAKLTASVVVGANKYIRVPCGDLPQFHAFMRNNGYDLKIRSLAPKIRIRPIRFTGTLHDYQEDAKDGMIAHKRGILKSPPRTGKTVMAAAIVCELGLKTIIVASQRDWLVGFHETFVGSDTQKPLTDLKANRIGFARRLEDFEKYDVCLVTVQTFHSEAGQKLLAKVRDMFSVLIIDEVHTSAANKYLSAVSRLNVRYAFGLSGTPSRKDQRMVLSNAILGPVVHKTEVPRLQPRVRSVRTQYTRPNMGKGGRPIPWAYLVGGLENDKKRQKLIAKFAIRDMEAGHLILIPMNRIKAINNLIKVINDMAGRKLAYPFFGGLKKEIRVKTIEAARKYKIKCLVGQTKLLSTGINIPRASAVYDGTLSSNLENCEQRVSRILTPYDGKPEPLLRIFLDNFGVRRRCLSNEWFNCIRKKFNPIMSDSDRLALEGYLKESDRRISADVDIGPYL